MIRKRSQVFRQLQNCKTAAQQRYCDVLYEFSILRSPDLFSIIDVFTSDISGFRLWLLGFNYSEWDTSSFWGTYRRTDFMYKSNPFLTGLPGY